MNKNKNGAIAMLFSHKGTDVALLLLRLAAGVMIMTHGITKIANFTELSNTFFDPIGLGSKASLILIILAEVGASAFIIIGALTRLAALALVFGMVIATFLAHPPFVFSESETSLLYLLIFTVILIAGAGKYSVDELIYRKKS